MGVGGGREHQAEGGTVHAGGTVQGGVAPLSRGLRPGVLKAGLSCALPPGPAARPVRSAQSTGAQQGRSTREAVLADAQALLAVYGEAAGKAQQGRLGAGVSRAPRSRVLPAIRLPWAAPQAGCVVGVAGRGRRRILVVAAGGLCVGGWRPPLNRPPPPACPPSPPGVGEESGAELTHAVVELLFTTSIECAPGGGVGWGVSARGRADQG